MTHSSKQFKLGVLGAGSFARSFIPLFQAHPLVGSVCLAETLPDRRREIADRFDIEHACEDLDQLCDSDCDAIAIFTQRWMHGPQAVQALKAGKHVYCAVPAAVSIEQIQQLVQAVESTGRIYMLGETTRYHPSNIFCRQKHAQGEFGDVVYAEAEYLHDMDHGFKRAYQFSGGDQWAKTASFPPMLYPTHSVGNILSAVGGSMKSVSCLGFRDMVNDGIFDKTISLWNNDLSNETALFEMSNGAMARANEFRRIAYRGVPGKECVRLKVFGTKAVFEQTAAQDHWIAAGDDPDNWHTVVEDVTERLDARAGKGAGVSLEGGEQDDFFSSMSNVHPVERLPGNFARMHSGHSGSHQFLVDDFARAVATKKHPFLDVWFAARVCAAGVTAHESALRGGERLPIPQLGERPATLPALDYSDIRYT